MLIRWHLLAQINQQPEDFLPEPTLACLRAFLVGYDCIRGQLGFEDSGLVPMRAFTNVLAAKLNVRERSNDAFGIITLVSEHGNDAFRRFFNELEAFRKAGVYLKCEESISEEQGNEPVELFSLLEGLRKRPAFYLGWSSITLLRAFVNGCEVAAKHAGKAGTQPNFRRFDVWLQREFNLTQSRPWHRSLLFIELGDENRAIRSFFELMDRFVAANLEQREENDLI